MIIARRSPIALREIWPMETDFSDWLVSEDGIAMIAEDIGLTIEEPRRECRPGDYPCDVVARLQGDENHAVIIENQFGKTNHDHLGKLITYAAVNDATTAIWISETASDDHRKAVDWLNENTPPNVNFYLARIHAYRIGSSPAAPLLDVVCRPNFQVKSRPSVNGDRQVWLKDFWEDVLGDIRERNPPYRVQSPSTAHWSAITTGRSGFYMAISTMARSTKICCEFIINTSWRLDAFAQLEEQREEIEREIGESLEWLALPEMKQSRIQLQSELDPRELANREEIKKWMFEKSVAFYLAFSPRTRILQPSANAIIQPEQSE